MNKTNTTQYASYVLFETRMLRRPEKHVLHHMRKRDIRMRSTQNKQFIRVFHIFTQNNGDDEREERDKHDKHDERDGRDG